MNQRGSSFRLTQASRLLRGRATDAGFTLLELLVVLGIASLLLTLVPLSFSSGLDLVRSKAAARQLSATLQQARSLAVARAQIVDVHLDGRAGNYRIVGEKDSWSLPDSVRLSLIDAQREETHEERGRIRFFPDGSSSGGRLTLDDGTRRFEIAVQWLLGRVSVAADEAS